MNWISINTPPPQSDKYYFVWILASEYGKEEGHGDMCYWDGVKWSDGVFSSVDNGASVSHWQFINPPQKGRNKRIAHSVYCTIDGCRVKTHAKGLCKMHYERNRIRDNA